MPLDPRLPVVIGGGQVSHRAASVDDALSPVELMAEAVRRAATDAGLGAVPNPDSIRVVEFLSWRYRDPARYLAEALGVTTRQTASSTSGGNSPQSLVNRTAGEIQRGELDLVVLAGAEAWRTRMRARRAGTPLPWPVAPTDLVPDAILGDPLKMSLDGEIDRGVIQPIQVYPIFETAIRAAAGRTPSEQQAVAGALWARFSDVAAANPAAWSRTARTAEEITTPGPTNRMIGSPYPKLMNSNNDVDQGAAIIMCSVETAQRLGVPRDRWVFLHAGTDCHEHTYVSHRWSFDRTPAVEAGGRVALELAGIGIDDVELVDLYSCFPSAVQLGANSLGLSLDRQLTRTGGLTFAGGPWNNYVMHAMATMVGDARERPGAFGLVWANGGFVTKHAFGVYSTEPPTEGYRSAEPQAEIDALPRRELAAPAEAAGSARIEGYTVMHDRDGEPEQALASCLIADGRRAWGTSADRDTTRALLEGEWVGRTVELTPEGDLRV